MPQSDWPFLFHHFMFWLFWSDSIWHGWILSMGAKSSTRGCARFAWASSKREVWTIPLPNLAWVLSVSPGGSSAFAWWVLHNTHQLARVGAQNSGVQTSWLRVALYKVKVTPNPLRRLYSSFHHQMACWWHMTSNQEHILSLSLSYFDVSFAFTCLLLSNVIDLGGHHVLSHFCAIQPNRVEQIWLFSARTWGKPQLFSLSHACVWVETLVSHPWEEVPLLSPSSSPHSLTRFPFWRKHVCWVPRDTFLLARSG